MNKKRLTLSEGHPCGIMMCTQFNCHPENPDEHCDTRRIYDRLRAFENLEEQGRIAEIVRCKDCKYSGDCIRAVETITRNHVLEQNIHDYYTVSFCSNGERRDKANAQEGNRI